MKFFEGREESEKRITKGENLFLRKVMNSRLGKEGKFFWKI